MEAEIAVQDTNAEAMASKVSAINKGYFQDPFARVFINAEVKKDVIINRGYWARVQIFRQIITKFLQQDSAVPKQIVSLGAGYDTLYFNLMSDATLKNTNFTYYEIDLPAVVTKKIKKIANSKTIQQQFATLKPDDQMTAINSENYHLIGCDLSNVDAVREKLTALGIKFDQPTFFFAECVFAYIDSDAVDRLLASIVQDFQIAFVMDYEMYNPTTPFGKMMVKNFDRKGCPLIGIHKYPTLESNTQRLNTLGFQRAEVFDMLNVYRKYCDQNERKRIEKLELLDEFEEWNMMMAHYFVSLAAHFTEGAKQNAQLAPFADSVRIE